MSGVALVGYSGSLVKEAVKQDIVNILARALDLSPDHTKGYHTAAEDPEVTKVLVGTYHCINLLILLISIP